MTLTGKQRSFGGRARPPLTVLGAGPVGLVAAIRARQLGLGVEIRSDRMPSPTDPSRLEVVPAQLVALLVELGVPPRSVGVDRLHERAAHAVEVVYGPRGTCTAIGAHRPSGA